MTPPAARPGAARHDIARLGGALRGIPGALRGVPGLDGALRGVAWLGGVLRGVLRLEAPHRVSPALAAHPRGGGAR